MYRKYLAVSKVRQCICQEVRRKMHRYALFGTELKRKLALYCNFRTAYIRQDRITELEKLLYHSALTTCKAKCTFQYKCEIKISSRMQSTRKARIFFTYVAVVFEISDYSAIWIASGGRPLIANISALFFMGNHSEWWFLPLPYSVKPYAPTCTWYGQLS